MASTERKLKSNHRGRQRSPIAATALFGVRQRIRAVVRRSKLRSASGPPGSAPSTRRSAAARAYDQAARIPPGENTRTNFCCELPRDRRSTR
ncbi:hypothetical protein HPP92_027502 [Vanilla planifolia]|uniref:Uncharacterized protein n=1 Tax=Vanilla planifolia TaxID=51239 RepID=A0A835PBL2_VANPL|nr:hypothetical protein HPP92_027502 [Vanilla planifolia]KAG0449131.1 hypothetical protein HPP92_027518 [Vanilla planifolia]